MLLALVTLARAEGPVLLLPVTGVNLSSGEIEAVERLFRIRLEREEPAAVLSAQTTRALLGSVAGTEDPAQAACVQVGCRRRVAVDVVRLDRDVLVRVTEHDGAGTLRMDLEARAAGLDDLVPLFDRMVLSLATGAPVDATITPHNVTALEARLPNRVPAEKLTGPMFGVWSNMGASSLAAGFDLRAERDAGFFEVCFGAAIPMSFETSDAFGGIYANVGWSALLLDGNTSTYVGFAAGPRIFSWGEGLNVTLGTYGQVGVALARHSSTRPFVQFRAGADLAEGGLRGHLGVDAGVGF